MQVLCGHHSVNSCMRIYAPSTCKSGEGVFNSDWREASRNQLEEDSDTMNWQDRILVDPGVLTGKPVIKGTRIALEFLIELLAERWTHEQILKNYPQLTEEDIQAALHYAAEVLKQEHVYPLP